MIALSRRQVKEADRVGGIELMIRWPADLGPIPSDIGLDEDREATRAEKAAAEAMIGASCREAGLVPVHVRIACVMSPPPRHPTVYLAVTIIGRRWVHVGGNPEPKVMFAT